MIATAETVNVPIDRLDDSKSPEDWSEPPEVLPKVVLPGEHATINETAAQLGHLCGARGELYMRGGQPMLAAESDEGGLELKVFKSETACSFFETVASLRKIRKAKDRRDEVQGICNPTTAKQIIC